MLSAVNLLYFQSPKAVNLIALKHWVFFSMQFINFESYAFLVRSKDFFDLPCPIFCTTLIIEVDQILSLRNNTCILYFGLSFGNNTVLFKGRVFYCNPKAQLDKTLPLCIFVTCFLIIHTFIITAMITSRNSGVTRLTVVGAVPNFTFRSKTKTPHAVPLTQM